MARSMSLSMISSNSVFVVVIWAGWMLLDEQRGSRLVGVNLLLFSVLPSFFNVFKAHLPELMKAEDKRAGVISKWPLDLIS